MNSSSRRPCAPSRASRVVRTTLFASVGAAALLALSGCYYYPAAYGYNGYSGYAASPYYATAPAPAVAVAPAYSAYPAYAYPAYSYPSVSVGIGGYWGGGRGWRR